jgi:adenine-specific DNA-methyltransferase
MGKRDDGSELEGEYITGKTIEKEKSRSIQQISFIAVGDLTTVTKKKQLVALLGEEKLPQSAVKKDTAFIVSENHPFYPIR